MRAVDDRDDTAFARAAHEFGDGKHQRRGRSEVAQEEHLGPRCHAGPHGFDDLPDRMDWKRHRLSDVPCAPLAAEEGPRAIKSAVLVVGRQDLVAGLQRQGTGDSVESGGGIRHEHKVVRVGANKCGQRPAGGAHEIRKPSPQELDGLRLELVLPRLVALEHRFRARTERPVVQVGDARPQHEEVTHARGDGVVHPDADAIRSGRVWPWSERRSRATGPRSIAGCATVLARLGGAEVDAGLRVAPDRLVAAEDDAVGLHELVAASYQRLADILPESVVAAGARVVSSLSSVW